MMEYIRKQIKEVKDYSTNSLKSLKKTIPKEEVDALIKVKEVIKDVEMRKKEVFDHNMIIRTLYGILSPQSLLGGTEYR